MKNNNFKSAQHTANYQNLMINKANKKQPVKIYTAEERAAFAAQVGMNASDKPVSEPKTRKQRSVVEEKTPVDFSLIPEELLVYLSK